jgi:hypothetical protein
MKEKRRKEAGLRAEREEEERRVDALEEVSVKKTRVIVRP